MTDVTTAAEFKNWLTSAAIVCGGLWALWRFRHSEWLRRRSEIPCLEGITAPPEIHSVSGNTAVASLRWTWRNAGIRPVHVDCQATFVQVYKLPHDIVGIIDPRQQQDELFPFLVVSHTPLDVMVYNFEPGTTSSILTPVALPISHTYIARFVVCADAEKHPTGNDTSFFWERWQVFRTDPPSPAAGVAVMAVS